MPIGVADWHREAVLYVNFGLCCVCHDSEYADVVKRQRYEWAQSAKMSGKSKICQAGEAEPSFGHVCKINIEGLVSPVKRLHVYFLTFLCVVLKYCWVCGPVC
jgi:hypothetical protein